MRELNPQEVNEVSGGCLSSLGTIFTSLLNAFFSIFGLSNSGSSSGSDSDTGTTS